MTSWDARYAADYTTPQVSGLDAATAAYGTALKTHDPDDYKSHATMAVLARGVRKELSARAFTGNKKVRPDGKRWLKPYNQWKATAKHHEDESERLRNIPISQRTLKEFPQEAPTPPPSPEQLGFGI